MMDKCPKQLKESQTFLPSYFGGGGHQKQKVKDIVATFVLFLNLQLG